MGKNHLRVFVDSDVVISSVNSETGAAYFLVREASIKRFVSNISREEIESVVERKRISRSRLGRILRRLTIIKQKLSDEEISERYQDYTTDPGDTHIVAGAVSAKVKFLITYNLKHYKVDQIKTDFKILTLTPAELLQYLRSL